MKESTRGFTIIIRSRRGHEFIASGGKGAPHYFATTWGEAHQRRRELADHDLKGKVTRCTLSIEAHEPLPRGKNKAQ